MGDDLAGLKEENERLKAELATVKEELEASQESNSDLTQAVANVTVEKTKLDIQVKNLKDKLEKAKAAIAAKEVASSKSEDSEKTNELSKKVDELKEANAALKDELNDAKKETAKLKEQLEESQATISSNEKDKKSLKDDLDKIKKELEKLKTEKKETEKQLSSSEREIKDLRSSLEKEKKEKDLTVKSLSEKIVSLEEELANSKEMLIVEVNSSTSVADAKSDKKAEEDTKVVESKNALDGDVTKKDTPTEPTIISDKLSDKVETTPTKKEISNKSSNVAIVSDDDTRSSRDVTPMSGEESDIFDAIKPISRLSSSGALQKSHLSSQLRRKKPSRSHVQSMITLSPFPEEMPSLTVSDEEEKRRSFTEANVHVPSVAPKPRSKLAEDKGAPVAAPKPKPRPQPRKKQLSPDHSSTEQPIKTPPESPVPSTSKPVPVPRTPQKENPNKDDDPSTENTDAVRSESDTKHSSSPEVAIKPKPRPHSAVKTETEPNGDTPTANQPPTPAKKPKPVPPKPEKKPSDDGLDAKIEALKQKDPSELTVKEKMMLAQQAMAKQAELKSKGMPPPPVRKRPVRADSVDTDMLIKAVTPSVKVNEEEVDSGNNMDRSHSMDNIVDESDTPKRQPRKLPPGAFSIGIPMGLPGDNRGRSYTVGSTSTEKSLESSNEVSKTDITTDDDHEDMSTMNDLSATGDKNKPDRLTPVSSAHSTPQTTPAHKTKDGDDDEPIDTTNGTLLTPEVSSNVDTGSLRSEEGYIDDSTSSPTSESLLETGSRSSSTLHPDVEQVLYWTPDVVGMWMSSIGLGQYAAGMKEKEIRGYQIFDIDTAKLKSMGMSSGEERKIFTKEVKNLKPYAERLKKEHDRQKKEEKKRLEQEKKAKKKKK